MSPPDRVVLHLELDLASEPIEGEVQAADGASHPFVGWLGLTSALEHAGALLELAELAAARGEPGEARRHARRAVALLDGRVPADHPLLREARDAAAG